MSEVPILVAKLRHVHRVIGVVVGELPLLAVEPGDGIPLALGDVEEAARPAEGVEDAAHGAALVGVVDVEEVVDATVGPRVLLGGNVAGDGDDVEELSL